MDLLHNQIDRLSDDSEAVIADFERKRRELLNGPVKDDSDDDVDALIERLCKPRERQPSAKLVKAAQEGITSTDGEKYF